MNRSADTCNTGGVCARKIVTVTQRNLGLHLDLAADVGHEGLVCHGRGVNTFKVIENFFNLAAMFGITHVAGEVNNDATTVRIGNIKAFNLSTGSRNGIHDLRNRKVGFVDFKTVGRGV